MIIIGHKKQWEFLKKKFELNQLSHAYLFRGYNAIGKRTLAIEFVKLLNCKRDKAPCQKCFSCQAIEKNSFPDLMIIRSINSKSSIENKRDNLEIDISQIREARDFLKYKSYYGSFKSVIIDDAERMDIKAQDCFLKTLEEPRGRTMIILISSKPDKLSATIFSRCQTLKFSKPLGHSPMGEAKDLKNQEILNNLLPVINSSIADKFNYIKSIDFDDGPGGTPLGEILEVLQRYYRDILLKDYKQTKVIKILNLIEDINNKLLFTNVNSKLALEILLMET